MITILPRGHSMDTSHLYWRRHPGQCYYCHWKEVHASEYAQAGASRLARSARLSQAGKKGWEAKKSKLGLHA